MQALDEFGVINTQTIRRVKARERNCDVIDSTSFGNVCDCVFWKE